MTSQSSFYNFINLLGDAFANNISLSEDRLLSKARRITGLSDFGDDAFREPLEILLDSIEKDARLNLFGRLLVRRTLVQKLVNRLCIQNDFKTYPDILDTPVQRPLFITGLARTGTTFLYRLLAQDPDTRTFQLWELISPSPPTDCDNYQNDPRRIKLKRGLTFRRLLKSKQEKARSKSIHESDYNSPEECWPLFQNMFLAPIFPIFLNVTGYDNWLQDQDMLPAYQYYKQQLQLLLWHCSKNRTVLKDPMHLSYLDEILSIFPDAVIIWTHRDPIKAIASGCSLISTVREKWSNHVDHHEIGRFEFRNNSRAVARGMKTRERTDSDRFIDIDYYALVRDPVGVVRQIYQQIGERLSGNAETCISNWLKTNLRNRRKSLPHRYNIEMFGLSPNEVNHNFVDYRERFSIPVEQH